MSENSSFAITRGKIEYLLFGILEMQYHPHLRRDDIWAKYISVKPNRRAMCPDSAVDVPTRGQTGTSSPGEHPGGGERHLLCGAHGISVAHVAP